MAAEKDRFSTDLDPFFYDGNWWDASIHCEGLEDNPKGIPVNIYFAFLSPEYHVGHLFEGIEFQLWDGRVIANGVVIKVIDLEQSAVRTQKIITE
jgi:hypothetical protein